MGRRGEGGVLWRKQDWVELMARVSALCRARESGAETTWINQTNMLCWEQHELAAA